MRAISAVSLLPSQNNVQEQDACPPGAAPEGIPTAGKAQFHGINISQRRLSLLEIGGVFCSGDGHDHCGRCRRNQGTNRIL